MADALYDFGPIDEIKPEAIGVPGNRRFRILFRKGRQVACFWLEKQQMGLLADTINELLAQVEGGFGQGIDPQPTGNFPEPFTFQYQTGRMALDYNPDTDYFSMLMFDVEAELALQEEFQGREEEIEEADLRPTFRGDVTRSQLEKFYNDAASVITVRPNPKIRL
jgi:uncharacterized repeat protein (TIGR03847 family)